MDTSSSNILLDGNLTARVADFGFSMRPDEAVMTQQKTLYTAVIGQGLPGTRGYLCPEFKQEKYSKKSDVYSFGVVSSAHNNNSNSNNNDVYHDYTCVTHANRLFLRHLQVC